MTRDRRDPLVELARAFGVSPTWRAADRRLCRASDTALLGVLRALGAPVERRADVPDALRERRAALWTRTVEPVAVTWTGDRPELTLRVPAAAGGRLRLELTLEDGGRSTFDADGAELPVHREVTVEGTRFRKLAWALRESLPPGCHAARLELQGRAHEFVWIVAPQRCHPVEGRLTGVFVPLYALHSARRRDCADLADWATLGRFAAEHGVRLTGSLPLCAAFLDPPVEPSPYAPVSRLFWNEVYLDLDALPEARRSDAARALLEAPRRPPADRDHVDWPAVTAHRLRVLELCAAIWVAGGGTDTPELRAFLAEPAEPEAYARFRAYGEVHGRDWRAWPASATDPGRALAGRELEVFHRHLYAQWRLAAQLEALVGGEQRAPDLYLDLPLGVHPDGFDAFRYRDALLSGCSAGAPPDAFFTRGQDWGFAPPDPEGSRRTGHRYFRTCLARQLRYCSVLRIDHVMGLHRIWCVPHGLPADQGAYVRQPARELYALLALESRRHRCSIVGEDLGTVPEETERALERHGVLSMHIVQFELVPGRVRTCVAPPRGTLAGLNTHDMPPFAAWFRALDVEDRLDLGLLDTAAAERERRRRGRLVTALARVLDCPPDPEPVLEHLLLRLASSPADVLLVNLEDLWLEERPQNVPGTGPDVRPNWRRRIRPTLEDVLTNPGLSLLLRSLTLARGGCAHGEARAT